MSHQRVFWAVSFVVLLIEASPLGYSKSANVTGYILNSEAKILLANKSSGECFGRVNAVPIQEEGNRLSSRPKTVRDLGSSGKWIPVVCEAEVTPNFLYWLEVRLSHAGVLEEQNIYSEGMKVQLDERLYKAIEDFQTLHDLDKGGITYETINALSKLDIPAPYRIFRRH